MRRIMRCIMQRIIAGSIVFSVDGSSRPNWFAPIVVVIFVGMLFDKIGFVGFVGILAWWEL